MQEQYQDNIPVENIKNRMFRTIHKFYQVPLLGHEFPFFI